MNRGLGLAFLAAIALRFCTSCEEDRETSNIAGVWRDTAGDGSGITLYLEQDGSRISGTPAPSTCNFHC